MESAIKQNFKPFPLEATWADNVGCTNHIPPDPDIEEHNLPIWDDLQQRKPELVDN
jgi:hypothetical protein